MPSIRFLYGAFAGLAAALAGVKAAADLPSKIYGVNLGSWLLIEPWMLPEEWVRMGGEQCNECAKCIASEFAFAKAYPNTVDAKFKEHWQTWFSQKDVDEFVAAGINTVRVPLGYWIVEPLVDRKTEFYAKGGILQLRRGLKQLRDAGITVILDHHALPGVQSPNQMFAGQCTDDVQFYTPYNYHRALIWSGVMTVLSHLDPAFSSVAAIEAMNEPIMDSSKTPGYGDFQKNFVQVVRAVELGLGIPVPGTSPLDNLSPSTNITSTLTSVANVKGIFNDEVKQVLKDMVPVLAKVLLQLALNPTFDKGALKTLFGKKKSLITNFMDMNWQWGNPANPADAAIGPQVYDNHLYYSFGGVADANEEAYLTHVCNLDRLERAAEIRNTPLYFGEWGLSTQFEATDEFLKKWADAQKYSYSKGAGWIFWNFKIENSTQSASTARQWSYFEGLRRGYLTQDPSKYNDPNVCAPYLRA